MERYWGYTLYKTIYSQCQRSNPSLAEMTLHTLYETIFFTNITKYNSRKYIFDIDYSPHITDCCIIPQYSS